MNPNPLSYLHDQLADMEAKGLHFRLRVLEGEQKPVAHFDGKDVINLSSNNYLGLTTHKSLRRAAIEAIRTHGVGAGAVRTIAGTMDLHGPRTANRQIQGHGSLCGVSVRLHGQRGDRRRDSGQGRFNSFR